MTYLVLDAPPPQGKKILSLMRTQKKVRLLGEPNSKTKFAIEDARKRKVKRAKGTKDLFRRVIG